MDIELQTKILKLKGFLNEVNHISYSYSQIGKTYPFDNLTNQNANQIVIAYQDLLEQVKILILNYEKSKDK
jgi:hypothetical protein